MRRWTLKLMNDEALFAAYAGGEAQAFERLYQRHKSALFSFLKRQCDNSAACEDLAHDTWIAVIKQASNFTPDAKFKTWLFRIAHNRLVDHWRKHGSKASVLFQEIDDLIGAQADLSSQGLELKDLLDSLKLLSTDQTETLLLKIEGFSHAEIADITNTKQETVKSRLRYATKQLRVSMEVS